MKKIEKFNLSDLWQHNIDHDCGAITAFRKYDNCGYKKDSKGKETDVPCEKGSKPKLRTKKENMFRNVALRADLMKMGYGMIGVSGKSDEGGEIVKELSYFVVDKDDKGTLKKDLMKLGEKYEQDSILYVPKGAVLNGKERIRRGSLKGIDDKSKRSEYKQTSNYPKAVLIGTNKCCNNWLKYHQEEEFEKGKFGMDSPIYTSYVNGRPFIFESIELFNANGFSGKTQAIVSGMIAADLSKIQNFLNDEDYKMAEEDEDYRKEDRKWIINSVY